MTVEHASTPPTSAASGNGADAGAAGPSRLARRVLDVPPSGIRKFFDVIATMPDVISLGIGEPDFTTPPQIVEEGVRSLRAGRTHYTSNFGTIELRRALVAQPRAAVRRDATTPTARSWSPSAPPRRWPSRSPPSSTRATRSSSTSRRTWRTCRASPSRAACRCSCPRPGRGRLGAGPGEARGGHHAAHQGAVPGLPLQPHGRRAGARASCAPSRTSRRATTSSSSATRSTTGWSTAATGTRRSARCRACATGRSCWAASPRRTP